MDLRQGFSGNWDTIEGQTSAKLPYRTNTRILDTDVGAEALYSETLLSPVSTPMECARFDAHC